MAPRATMSRRAVRQRSAMEKSSGQTSVHRPQSMQELMSLLAWCRPLTMAALL
jgi:hypothetical protein